MIARTIYLAGKITKDCWRHEIVDGLREANYTADDSLPQRWEVIRGCIGPGHHYAGPFFTSCDHGCAHGAGTHGLAARPDTTGEESCGCIQVCDFGDRQRRVRSLCLNGIQACDLFFAWIAERDCYGTIAELGYARALGREIVVAGPRAIDDMWFIYTLADKVIHAPSPSWALAQALLSCQGVPA